jgi:hypothetical protein
MEIVFALAKFAIYENEYGISLSTESILQTDFNLGSGLVAKTTKAMLITLVPSQV